MVSALDASRHSIIYLANPMVGARGIHYHLVTHLGGEPRFHRPALIAQTAELLAAEHDERRKQVVLHHPQLKSMTASYPSVGSDLGSIH